MEKKVKPKVNINIESLFIGDEPEWGNPKTEIPVTRALSWYANQKDWKDSKKYTIDFAKTNKFSKQIIEKLTSSSEDLYKNLGFVCRMVTRGAPLDRQEWIKSRIDEIINYDSANAIVSNLTPTKVAISTKSIQDRMFDQASIYIAEIEGHVDDYIKNRKSTFKCYDWLIANSIKPIYLAQIKEHYAPWVTEITLANTKQDEDLVESYSHWTKKELTAFLQFINDIINDCDKYGSNTKTVKKVTKKKVVTADKKVAKLQYKKEDTESKLASVNPTDISAASQLWIYNVKYKKLGVYYAKDEAGFGIKGTTLENFDEVLSISKTLRKPLEILPIVTKGKKTDLKKLMKEIKTKEDKLTGRINSDTILVKVIK
jgi:hypothetical protein